MNLPPDQLRVRLQAAIATLRRLTEDAHTNEETHVALCRAQWRLAFELEVLEAAQRG